MLTHKVINQNGNTITVDNGDIFNRCQFDDGTELGETVINDETGEVAEIARTLPHNTIWEIVN